MENLEEKNEDSKTQEDIRSSLLDDVKEYQDNWLVFLIRKSKLTILIIISLLVFGSVTIKNLPRELSPEVEIPIAVVSTAYPGASPLDVEEQITKEIENEISDISGVEEINSTSSLGFSSVVVEFEAGEDLDKSIRDLKDKVDIARPSLPDDATDPQVIEISLSDQPIVEVALSSSSYDVAELKQFAENLKDRVKGVAYVSDVVIVGGRERVIKIEIDQEKVAQRGLAPQGIISSLAANNVNFPLGSIEIENSRYNVRVAGKFESVNEIAQMPVGASSDGSSIFLEDVANVQEDFSSEYSRSRFSVNGGESLDAVSLQVYKRTGGDVTGLAQEIVNRVEKEKGNSYPENVEAVVTNDLSKYVTDSLGTLFRNGTATVLLIFTLLLIFLGWREAFLAGLAIPFAFFVAFIIMSFTGESLNTISLFALVLSLGLLVDSAIVVVEGMYNKVSRFRLSGYQSAISTIKEYAAPVISGMLTTVAAFFPLLFVMGIFGQFIKTIPVVVISTLFAGLFVSLSIIPAFGVYLISPISHRKNKNGCEEGKLGVIRKMLGICKKHLKSKPRSQRFATKLFDRMSALYERNIPKILANKKKRVTVIVASWILFFAALSLPILGLLKVQAFGKEDSDFFYINLEMPNGTILERTDQIVLKIENELKNVSEIKNFVVNTGASVGSQGASEGSERSSNRAFIQVNLIPEGEREIKSFELISKLRDDFDQEISEGAVSFLEAEAGPPSGSAVELRVLGDDLVILEDLADQIASELETIPTTIDIETSVELSPGEFVFIPNKDLVSERGFSVVQIAANLRAGIARDDSVEITKNGEELKLDLGYNEDRIFSIEDVKDLEVVNSKGDVYYLSEMGEIKFTSALASISRRDNERAITITAGTDGGNPTEITNELKARLENFDLPGGYSISFGGEAQELQEVYMDMLLKMLLGIIIILFILVLQFNSYKQTLIILFTIPLAMIGVFTGMTVFRMQLDIPAFIGIVSLAGIVVNNAIILIDQINKEIRSGKHLIEAAKTAGCLRMRPIFLTTITTVVGLLPLSITEPIWRNLGFAIIFGLIFSTLLTLIIVPTLFVSLYRKQFGVE